MPPNVKSFTERLLIDAGIEPGMTVIDVGCGPGEVSFLLTELVGPDGRVIGVDRDSIAINTAQDRAHLNAVANARFDRMDLTDRLPNFGVIDAIVGRRVLMYLSDAADVVHRLSASLRPGGIVVFQEHDMTMVPASLDPMPLHEQAQKWIVETVKRDGGNINIGFHLPRLLRQAGLDTQLVRAEAVIQGHGSNDPLATVVRSMVPRMVEHGVATKDEIDLDTLEQRLAAERSADIVLVSDMAFGAWARKPSAS